MAEGSKLMSYSHACAHISDGLILGAREREKKKESQSLTSKHGGTERNGRSRSLALQSVVTLAARTRHRNN